MGVESAINIPESHGVDMCPNQELRSLVVVAQYSLY